MSARTGSAPRPQTYSTTPDAIATYREKTGSLAPSSQRFICATCKQSRQVLGRKCIKVDGNRRYYECEICTKRAQAWAQLEFDIAQCARATVPIENFNQVRALLGLS